MAIRNIIKQLGIVFFFLLTSIICVAAFNPGENEGDDNGRPDGIFIEGSETGMKDQMSQVLFLHDLHTDALSGKDCNTCHASFPQEADGLKKMKEAGKLKPKQVMNKQCVKCHKDEKKAGNATGPTTCSTCHIR